MKEINKFELASLLGGMSPYPECMRELQEQIGENPDMSEDDLAVWIDQFYECIGAEQPA